MTILCGDKPGLRHSQKHLRVSAQGSIMLKSKGQYLIYSLRNMAAARKVRCGGGLAPMHSCRANGFPH